MTNKTKQTKGKWLTLKQKWQVVEQFRRVQPVQSLAELARWSETTFGLSQPSARATIRNIIQGAAIIERKMSSSITEKGRTRTLRSPELEDRLTAYVDACLAQHICLSRRLITWKAKAILVVIPNPPSLQLSDGWLTRFMKRHDLRFREMHGEAGSVDQADVEEGRMAMQYVTRHYALRDIWNMDESGLLYRSAKGRGICKSNTKAVKKDKTRITLALAATADGSEKREVFFIGRALRPMCFKGKYGHDLGFYYRNNKKAWMTMTLYSEWAREFDREMKQADRDILLLLDRISSTTSRLEK